MIDFTWWFSRESVRVGTRKAIQLLGATLGVLLFCFPAFAQLNLGRIFGGITDQSGGAIVGATVVVTDVQRGISRTLTTDEAGEYSAPSVIPGTYTVRAEAMGFRAIERQNVTVAVGQDVRVDLSLQPGEQTQTVTVTETIPMIQTTNAQLTDTLENQTINELPLNGREFTKLLAYRPGTKSNGLDIYVNGNRASSNSWMFDGLEDFNEWSASGPIVGGQNMFDEATILPIDTIQEVNVVDVPKAEYGWKPGAEVNVGLKSGTNNIHGTASAFGRDTAMDAKNQFLGVLPKAVDNMEQFGATIGGPILKNKLFYYAGYEGQRYAVGSPRFVQIPTSAPGGGAANSFPDAIAELNSKGVPLSQLSLNLAGCTAGGVCNATTGLLSNSTGNVTIPLSLNNEGGSDNGIGKIDYHPGDHNSFNGEYFAGDGYLINASSGITPYWRRASSSQAKLVRAVWIWNPNSSWVNEARFGYNALNQPQNVVECVQGGAPNYAALGFVTGANIPPPLCAFPQLMISGFTTLGQNTGQFTYFRVLQGADSVSYTRGKHLFKFGGEVHHVLFNGADNGNTGGTLNFGGSVTPPTFSAATSLEDFLAGVPASGQIQSGAGDRTVTFNRYALFVQDDWRLTPRVIVNLGVRWEYAAPYQEKNNLLGNFDPTTPTGLIQQGPNVTLWNGDGDNFAPRVGVAWDVTGKGTTVVRAGDSIVYLSDFPIGTAVFAATTGLNVIPTGWALQNANGSVLPSPGNIAVGVVTLVGSQVNWGVNQPIFNVGPGGLKCGNGLGQVDPTKPTGASNPANAPACTIQAMNPNIQLGYVNTWNLTVQHAITNNLSATLAYVGAHGSRLGCFEDINQPTLGIANTGKAPGSGNEQIRRPFYNQFPYLGQIREYTGCMISNYNALQATLTQRLTKGLALNVGYSYEHNLDESASEGGTLMNSNNPRLDYSNSIQDPFTHLTVSASYNIPGKKSPGQLLEGWQVSTVIDSLGGVPFTAKDSSTDFSGTGENNDRWTLVGNPSDFVVGRTALVPCWGVTTSKFGKTANCTPVAIPAGAVAGTAAYVANMPAPCVSAAAAEPTGPGGTTGTASLGSMGCYMQGNSVIVPPAQGTFGSMARGILRGAPLRTWDMSVAKGWKFKERLSAEFRAEFFNVINAPFYAQPSGSVNSPSSFGQAQTTPSAGNPIVGQGGPREVQLGLRLMF
jgi:hypothetical protein